jgi:hypothetical protein
MTDLLLLAIVILLVVVWSGVRKTSRMVSILGTNLGAILERLDTRLQDIEQRVRDNFQTDEEREDQANAQPLL